jgi:hypothetical protein
MNIEEAIDQIQLNRTRYQMERFVVGQHHTPEMQYRQLLAEADTLLGTIRETELKIKKIKIEAAELRSTGKESDAIEADIRELGIKSLNRHLTNSRRELGILEEMFECYPKYSIEDIEAAQEEYWRERLLRTAHFQAMGGAITWAQIEAIWQAGFLSELVGTNPNDQLDKIKTVELPLSNITLDKE